MVTRYVDASMPDDTGNGLTPATAKRTPRAAQLAASAGDKILLKTGLCYAPSSTGTFFYFNTTSNIEIGTYGTASDKPILDALTYDNPGSTGWSYKGNGVWKKTYGYAAQAGPPAVPAYAWFNIRRLWIGSTRTGNLISQRVLGTAKRRATGAASGMYGATPNPTDESKIIAALSPHDIWFGAGLALNYSLYVYTGNATINPPDFYGGIAFIQSDGLSVGSVDGIMVRGGVSGIYAHDLHFRGSGSTAIHLYTQNSYAADVSDCLFEDCIVTAPLSGAFLSRICGELSPAQRLKSTTVRRVYCDYLSSVDEMEPDETYATLSGTSDLFNISDGSVAIIVDGCTAINSAHTGLTCGSTSMASAPPSGCKFINNTVRYDSWHTYARGLSNFDSDTLFSGNLIDGQNTRSQIAGSAKVIGNVWINLRNCSRKAGVAQWIAVESYIYDSGITTIGNERYVRINPVNILIANNTAYGPFNAAISFHFFTSSLGLANNSFAPGSITVENNIIHSPKAQFLDTSEDPGKTIGQQTLSNNCVYNAVTGDNKILWRKTNYTINSAPGCTNNIETDPQLDALYRPQSTGVKRGGVYVNGKDFYAKQFYYPPNIGAVDDLSLTGRWLLTLP